MRHLLVLFIVLCFHNTFYAKEFNGKIAFFTDGIDGLKFKDGRIAIDLWFNILAKDVDSNLSIEYYDDISKFIQDFKSHNFEYATINLYHYLNNSFAFEKHIQEYWAIQKGKHKLNEFVVLTHTDSGIKTLKDLDKKTIISKEKNYIDLIYLDKELLKSQGKVSADLLNEIHFVKSYSKAILDTFFKKADACIVPKYSFDLAIELNPILSKKLQVISRSGNIFLPIITFFHDKAPKRMLERFDKSVTHMHSTVAGKNIFTLFKMEDIYKLDKKVVQTQQKYFDEYLQLKKQHGYLK